jgi:hypothetical protein
MTPDPIIVSEIVKALGAAGVLWYLLRQANEERKDLTTKFLGTMETTLTTAATAITANTAALQEMRTASSAEHRELCELVRRATEGMKRA